MSLSLSFPFPPIPASRPRVGKFGTYYSKGYKAWRTLAAAALPARGEPLFVGPVSVEILVICVRPKKLTESTPVGDVDNYAKGPLDAITAAGIWRDDRQVARLLVTKRYAEPGESAATCVAIEAIQ